MTKTYSVVYGFSTTYFSVDQCSVCGGAFSDNFNTNPLFRGSTPTPLVAPLDIAQPAGTVVTNVAATLHGTCFGNVSDGKSIPVQLGSLTVGTVTPAQYANQPCTLNGGGCGTCLVINADPVTFAPTAAVVLPASNTVTIPSIATAGRADLQQLDLTITFCQP